ncbi:unnamed protein product, partial [Closterium sp. NIES-53]
TSGMGLVLGGRRPVVLTGHADASWADDPASQRSSQGYTFSLGSGSVSWRSTRSSSVLSSSCEAEIYAGAMAVQELRWLTYLLTDLGEPPCSPPVLYVDNKAMLALCREHRLEHRTMHIALRYFLARELQQRGQLRLTYVASEANTADIFTKALAPGDHQRFCTMLACFALLCLTGLVTSCSPPLCLWGTPPLRPHRLTGKSCPPLPRPPDCRPSPVPLHRPPPPPPPRPRSPPQFQQPQLHPPSASLPLPLCHGQLQALHRAPPPHGPPHLQCLRPFDLVIQERYLHQLPQTRIAERSTHPGLDDVLLGEPPLALHGGEGKHSQRLPQQDEVGPSPARHIRNTTKHVKVSTS